MANDRVGMLVEMFQKASEAMGLCAYCRLEPEDSCVLFLNASSSWDGFGMIPLRDHPSFRARKIFCYADHMLSYLKENPDEALICVPYEQTFSDSKYPDGGKGCARCEKDHGLFLTVDGCYGTYFDSAFRRPTYFCSVNCLTEELSERIQESVDRVMQEMNF